jgi:TPR repeat protein
MIFKGMRTMLSGSRFWFPVLAAGLLCLSGPAAAGPAEDYELGRTRFLEGDMVGAMTLLRKTVDAGYVKAMPLLAEILDISEFDDEAMALYRKAAQLGDTDGMFGLGAMYFAGEGGEKNVAEGLRWMRQAGELGHAQAITTLAHAYVKLELNLTPADRDTPDALRWVVEAAKKDFLPAVDALAEAYRTGGMLGVSPDPVLAAQYTAQSEKIRMVEPVKGKKKKKKAAAG